MIGVWRLQDILSFNQQMSRNGQSCISFGTNFQHEEKNIKTPVEDVPVERSFILPLSNGNLET